MAIGFWSEMAGGAKRAADGAITVIMPNRNHAHYVGSALEAICTQSRAPTRVLVVDDASTDDSVAVVKDFALRHPNVELTCRDSAAGTLVNLNTELARVQTEYVFCAAADDLILPGFFASVVTLLDQYPAVAFATTASGEMDEAGGLLPPPFAPPSTRDCHLSPSTAAMVLSRYGSFAWGNTTVYRTEMLRESGGFLLELAAFADGYLLQALALEHGCIYVPERLGLWRRSQEGNAGRLFSSPESVMRVLDQVTRMMAAKPVLFGPDYVNRFSRRWLFAGASGLFRNGLPDAAMQLAKLRKCEAWLVSILANRKAWSWIDRYLFVRLLADDLPILIRRKLVGEQKVLPGRPA